MIAKAPSATATRSRTSRSDEIGGINYRIEKARLESRRLDLLAPNEPGRDLSRERAALEKTIAEQQAPFRPKTRSSRP